MHRVPSALLSSYARAKAGVKRNPLISIGCAVAKEVRETFKGLTITSNWLILWVLWADGALSFRNWYMAQKSSIQSWLGSRYMVDAHVRAQHIWNED